MDVFTQTLSWLTDPAHWQGPNGIPTRVVEHVGYSVGATLVAAVIALPVALWIGHTGRGGLLAVNIANIGRAIPTFGLILAAFIVFGLNLIPVYIALVLMAIPPILTNAYVGLREVDPDVREAAEGTGMSGWQMLWRVEVPVAMPLIMTGLRTSAVQVVATATLAAVVGLGGLGRYLIDGLAQGVTIRPTARAMVIVGSILVATLAAVTELVLDRVERWTVADPLVTDPWYAPQKPGQTIQPGGQPM